MIDKLFQVIDELNLKFNLNVYLKEKSLSA
jgi:hypothetical protein